MNIELTNVKKSFGAQQVLCGVDLSVPHGTRLALVGPNGSGKSTLLRAIMGMLRVEGAVRLDGLCPFAERRSIAQKLAYVPQVAPQLGATVHEVVRTVSELRSLSAERIGLMAERVELSIQPLARKSFRSLSGGMKQKLLVALAFASDASLYILDEPTASLDTAARARFEVLLAEVAAGRRARAWTRRTR
jgi:ABC-type multidrug transport system ATPase subunit